MSQNGPAQDLPKSPKDDAVTSSPAGAYHLQEVLSLDPFRVPKMTPFGYMPQEILQAEAESFCLGKEKNKKKANITE